MGRYIVVRDKDGKPKIKDTWEEVKKKPGRPRGSTKDKKPKKILTDEEKQKRYLYFKEWCIKNADKRKKYNEEHRAEHCEATRRWKQDHKEQVREQSRRHYIEHQEELKKRARERYWEKKKESEI